jgi:hypothetical protein
LALQLALPHWRLWRYDPDKIIDSHVNVITVPPALSAEVEYAAFLNFLFAKGEQIRQEMLPLLHSQSAGIARRGIAAYLMVQARAVASGSRGWGAAIKYPEYRTVLELGTVGRRLLDHPQLPMIADQAYKWQGSLWDDLPEQEVVYPRIDRTAYLGAAAFLAIAAESLVTEALPRQGPKRLGPLSALYPYIALRCGASSETELPKLPIPAQFRQTFSRWARNEVNFVGSASIKGRDKDSQTKAKESKIATASHLG